VTAVAQAVRDAGRSLRRAVLGTRSEVILFDREGTLVGDLAPGGDPARLELVPGAADAVARARAAGVAVGVVASQAGEHALSSEETAQVNARVDELVGPVDLYLECTHDPAEDCLCRMPAPGLIYLAAAALGTRPEKCIVVGDVGEDVEAAQAAGARSVLVPTARTTPDAIDAAPVVASTLDEAVAVALGQAA
jgi:histidinol-phosphate phosphatase family protein